MTHPIDRLKNELRRLLSKGFDSLPLSKKQIEALIKPDPRVTALVKAAKASLGSVGYIGTSNELRAALAPFLKENQDAN